MKTEIFSKTLMEFLQENKVLHQFKINSSLYIFKDGRYKDDKIMNYINPKYGLAQPADGVNIFAWLNTKEGYKFWSKIHFLWKKISSQ